MSGTTSPLSERRKPKGDAPSDLNVVLMKRLLATVLPSFALSVATGKLTSSPTARVVWSNGTQPAHQLAESFRPHDILFFIQLVIHPERHNIVIGITKIMLAVAWSFCGIVLGYKHAH